MRGSCPPSHPRLASPRPARENMHSLAAPGRASTLPRSALHLLWSRPSAGRPHPKSVDRFAATAATPMLLNLRSSSRRLPVLAAGRARDGRKLLAWRWRYCRRPSSSAADGVGARAACRSPCVPRPLHPQACQRLIMDVAGFLPARSDPVQSCSISTAIGLASAAAGASLMLRLTPTVLNQFALGVVGIARRQPHPTRHWSAAQLLGRRRGGGGDHLKPRAFGAWRCSSPCRGVGASRSAARARACASLSSAAPSCDCDGGDPRRAAAYAGRACPPYSSSRWLLASFFARHCTRDPCRIAARRWAPTAAADRCALMHACHRPLSAMRSRHFVAGLDPGGPTTQLT